MQFSGLEQYNDFSGIGKISPLKFVLAQWQVQSLAR